MSRTGPFKNDFCTHEYAIELLYNVFERIVEVLNEYAAEEMTATQAAHACLAITGASDETIRTAIARAVAEGAMQQGFRRGRK
jgi:hypothetical protein